MSLKLKKDLNYRYVIRNASAKRINFRIEKRTFDKDWKTTSSQSVENTDLDAINAKYRSKVFTFEHARKSLEELVISLYKEEKAIQAVVHNDENYRILEDYWQKEYRRRKLVDEKTAFYELRRAVDAVGALSLSAATEDELQDAVDRFKGNKQRRIVAKLTILLRYIGRPEIRLTKERIVRERVKHLSDSEFKQFLPKLEKEHIRLLHEVCFHTGARIGEACAFEMSDLREKRFEVLILGQVDKKGARRETKNRTTRTAFIFPEGIEAFKKWVAVKDQLTDYERKHIAALTRQACQQVFPRNTDKHLKFHDLRHSYAIRLLNKGVGIDHVAQMIGDSVIVAKEHYVGHIISEAGMDYVRGKMITKKAKKSA